MSLPYRTEPRTWDVIVAGGGTAGAIAGIAAVRDHGGEVLAVDIPALQAEMRRLGGNV
ncbi:hypothetical protein [Deinococcus aluminii]|uniref:FAD-binding protein n=1 Tax=Deinococcus aluminii TaxID=1656885 RepID=A0ABP9XDD6_9DEIO